MALYNVVVKDRATEATTYDFGGTTPEVTTLSVELLRRGGCSTATFTICKTDYSAVEALLVGTNIVEISFDFGSGSTLVWSGRIVRVDKASNTPPKDKIRTVFCQGFWHDLKAQKVLKVYNDYDVDEIVEALIDSPFSEETGVSDSTAEVETGSAYNVAQTVFEDIDGTSCLTKLSELLNDTVTGVDENRRVYFRAETAESAASILTFRQGLASDAVTMFDRKEDWSKCVNHYIVEGRDAASGNPCSMESYDSDLDTDSTLPWRTKVVKAPDLVTGADLKQWGDYLVARDKDPKIQAKLSIADIGTKLSLPITCESLNANLTVNDSGGSLIGKYQMQAITYSLDGGVIAATIEIGNDLCRDEVDALGMRDLLRDLAAQEMKEFSNALELAAANSDFARDAHLTFAGNGLRNDWRGEIKDCNKSDSVIDWEHASIDNLRRTSGPPGITSKTMELSSYGTFVTKPIPVRGDFTKWAVLRNLDNKVWFDNAAASDKSNYFDQYNEDDPTLYWTASGGYIQPHCIAPSAGGNDFDGRLVCSVPVRHETSIIWKFKWGLPHGDGSDDYCRRYLLHHYQNNGNHYRILLKHAAGSPSKIEIGFEKTIAGSSTAHADAYRYVNLDDDDDEIRVTLSDVDIATNDRYKVTIENLTTEAETSFTTDIGWLDVTATMYRYGLRAWLYNAPLQGYSTYDYLDTWKFETIAFADSTAHADDFDLSRDGGTTWEGLYSADTGAAKTLGLAGDITETAILRGRVAFPQIITDVALGWGGR